MESQYFCRKHTSTPVPAFALLYIPISACFVILLSIGGCGIPSTSYMPPIPEDSIIRPLEGESFFTFGIPSDNNPEIFEGFEIYYRFYRIDDPALAAMVGDNELQTPVTRQALANARYRRLHNADESPELLSELPLIPILREDRSDSNLIITLDFGGISNTFPHETYANILLSRLIDIAGSAPAVKGFSSTDFSKSDPDIPPGIDVNTASNFYLSLYAMSYGNEISSISLDIHSTAVYLGRIRIDFDQLS